MKKWIITLAAASIVHGVLRQPIEGSLTVSEDEARRLFDNKLLVGEPEPVDGSDDELEADDDEQGDDGLDKMKVPGLHILVTKEGIPLHDAKKKDEIIAAIRKHREAKSAPDYERDSLNDLDLATASKDQLLVIAAYEGAYVSQGDDATEADLRTAITTHRA